MTQSDTFKLFIIEINAFNRDCEAVFLQIKEDNIKYLIIFKSKQFSSVKKNYDIFKWEFLIIKDALRKWHYYIKNNTTIII